MLRVVDRWFSFNDSFDSWVESQSMESYWLPKNIDIAALEPYRSIVFMPAWDADDTTVFFDINSIDRAAKTWMRERNDFLFSLIPTDIRNKLNRVAQTDDEGKFILPDLACLLFSKPKKGRHLEEPYTLADICRHRLIEWEANMPESEEDQQIHFAMRNGICSPYERPWKWDLDDFGLEFNTRAYYIAQEVVQFLGLDPFTVSLSDIEEYHLDMSCVGCFRYWGCIGRVHTRWISIVTHEMHYHDDGDIPMEERWSTR
ncbi:hypothetical protein NP233_g12595 [Leucocoprinus birnbaumii]|uniref:Uncharacterized protein n=1 Tax=Leucocoprinus birnbaumii TaxID=56174 RepID=A0AAD5VE85_9AGAR|nr:hypothetical protein NP233_g12595 [Leucocoprinus birnbaumii]